MGRRSPNYLQCQLVTSHATDSISLHQTTSCLLTPSHCCLALCRFWHPKVQQAGSWQPTQPTWALVTPHAQLTRYTPRRCAAQEPHLLPVQQACPFPPNQHWGLHWEAQMLVLPVASNSCHWGLVLPCCHSSRWHHTSTGTCSAANWLLSAGSTADA